MDTLSHTMNAALLATATVDPHPGMILPFAALLLAIAVMPFVHRHW